MQIKATISSIKILKNHVSITFSSSAISTTESVEKLKNRLLYFRLESPWRKIWFKGTIVSTGMRRNAYLVVHTPVHKAVILGLVKIRRNPIVLRLSVLGPGGETQDTRKNVFKKNTDEKIISLTTKKEPESF